MHLKTLRIKGFKSFADTATLDLEPGVTVVVGPNGSGKSNVVDAIAWVLGAQAPSAIRSQKMDDVIFAGTDSRSALGRCEVSLTIDNASGVLPIEFTEVTIARTLFRTGESEYSINGAACRLLDIQELLSDSGVGRQQHVIVGQGQIDAVLNARPEDRRLVIEEAAGVLKHRKRKERSERRLAATEGNLLRLQDLLRELRRQLRPLERQAEAARRHGDLIAELSALRVYVAGRELESLRASLAASRALRSELRETERDRKEQVAKLDVAVLGAEARLADHGGDDLGDALASFEALAERARGMRTLLAERLRGLAREREVSVDGEVVASWEAEAARLGDEMAAVERGSAELEGDRARLDVELAELGQAREDFERRWGDGVPAPSGEAAEARGELGALRSAVERAEAERDRLDARVAGLVSVRSTIEEEARALLSELQQASTGELPLVESRDEAQRLVEAAEAEERTAEVAVRDAERDLHSWEARREALALALDEARARSGAERLGDLPGVLGALVDLVEVDRGWEGCFEAAAGEALAAVVVDGAGSARSALSALNQGDATGAVVAPGPAGQRLPPPPVGEPVRGHVRGRVSEVDQLLDVLLESAVAVQGGWVAALDASLAHPTAIVVTAGGDRFTRSGWRLGAGGAGATGSALADAQREATDAAAQLERAVRRHAEARLSLDAARAELLRCSEELDVHAGAMSVAQARLERVEARRRDASTELDAIEGHRTELSERLARERRRLEELEALLPKLQAEEDERVDAGRRMGEARAALDERASAVGSLRADVNLRAATLEERSEFLRARLAGLESKLEGAAAQRDQAARRREELADKELATKRLAAVVDVAVARSEEALGSLRERRRRQSEAAREVSAELEQLRRERAAIERELAGLRERLSRAELEEAEARLRIEGVVEVMRRDLDCDPTTALAAPLPELPEGTAPAARVRELESELRIMGPINPLALEEYEALQERHEFLQAQLEDVKATRRELGKIIRAIDEEIVEVFAAAYADVSTNFEKLFATLFPGGTGKLALTDPEDLLATGIEVEAKPSGKNVKKLSLLSGGERSLTALAFLFAVFRSRPSPFYVMDEVEAALDDMNLHRFLDLVGEFRREAQLLIVSHQKRTMEAADCLYGVTMQPGGSSKVVSEKVGAGA